MRLGRYTVGALLGQGGAGRVYRATLHGPGGFTRPVALKILHHGSDAIRHEARLSGLLRHRGLIDVYEIGEADGQWFCAMELCDGGTLRAHIPLPPRAVVEVGLQVCAALQYAHEQLGLVHLDIKPTNLLLHNGMVKLADLGIARAQGFEGSGRIMGTPRYMPPEQRHGRPVSARTDLFALGMTLVELATGQLSHAATFSPAALPTAPSEDLSAEVTLDPGAWHTAPTPAADLPGWLAPAVLPCLHADPADRWPDMDALAAALRALDVNGPGLKEAIGWTPSLTPPPSPDTNLAPAEDAFVGRSAELSALAAALREPGLITLKGPGGSGKTRLATVAARRFRAATGAPVWFCDLTAATGTGELVASVAATLSVRLRPGPPAQQAQQLGHALAGHDTMLLILDNFEQLTACAEVVDQWRQQASQVRILVTSRAPLHLTAERQISLTPLPPADAAALLIARARQRGVDLTPSPTLTALIDRLDGLPLAVELAAGRLGVLSVEDVLDGLGDAMLRRGTDDRHSTLQAMLAESWRLLPEHARTALARLSVFRGGFTLEAAEAVLQDTGPSPLDVIDLLLDRSLLSAERGQRLRLLVSVQAFAAAHLSEPAPIARRHARWFARYADPDQPLDDAERDNLIAACRWAISAGEGVLAAQVFLGQWRILQRQGPYELAEEMGWSILEMPEMTGTLRIRVLAAAGESRQFLGRDDETVRAFEEALALSRKIGDRRLEGAMLGRLGVLRRNQGDLKVAAQLLQDALACHRACGDRRTEGNTQSNLGLLALSQTRLSDSQEHFEASRTIAEHLGDDRAAGIALHNLGIVRARVGDADGAMDLQQRALALTRQTRDRYLEAHIHGGLGLLAHSTGRLGDAVRHYESAIQLHRAVGNRRAEGIERANLGQALVDSEDIDSAQAHFAAAIAIHEEIGNRIFHGHALSLLAWVRGRQGAFFDAHALLDRGVSLIVPSEHANIFALNLVTRAEVFLMQDDTEQARAAITRARSLDVHEDQSVMEEIHRVETLLEQP